MNELLSSKRLSLRGVATLAGVIGAVAIGCIAIGLGSQNYTGVFKCLQISRVGLLY